MDLHKLIFTECDAYKAGRKITPKGVMVHSTGANNPNLLRYVGPNDGLLGVNKYNNHWNMPGVGASVHAFIGKLKDGSIATYQVLPWDYRAGHCYKGNNGSGNNTHIAFEICEDGLSDPEYFNKVYQEAVELTAMLCKEYNLDPMADGVVICHSEGYERGIASNHEDVMHWFPKHGKSMDTFRADVKAILTGNAEPKRESTYTLREFIEDVQRACGASVDGIAGPETISKTVTLSKSKNSTHAVVKAVQKRLYALGYTQVGKADGIAGIKFTAAVTAFQAGNGCWVDGEITAKNKTWKKLLGMV
jgi:N-acetylmuramoyl-L-alanine amidase CwlA